MIDTSTGVTVLLFILGTTGVLISAIGGMIYKRIGSIETLMRDTVRELQREDKLIHGRVSNLDTRITRVEARCESTHAGTRP